MARKIFKFIFPPSLWTIYFTYWWIVSLITILLFDVFWMLQTTFRPFTYYVFWPYLLLSSLFITFPTLFTSKAAVQAAWLIFVDFLLVANLMYCRTYYSAIPLSSYLLIGNLQDFTSSVTDSFKWYFIFLPILTLIALFGYFYLANFKSRKPNPFAWCVYMVIFFIAGWLGDALRIGTVNKIREMSSSSNLKGAVVPIYSLGGFLMYDLYQGSEKLTTEKAAEVDRWLREHEKFNKNFRSNSQDSTLRRPRNLVVILCESLESWVIGNQVEGKEVTPYLNRLVNDSTSFYAPNVVTQVGSGHSIDAQLLILAGLLPMYNKVYAYDAVGNEYFTIPKAMEERGAKTYLLTSDKPYVWNQEPVSRAFGWQNLIHNHDFENNEPVGIFKLLSDGELMRQSVNKMKQGQVWPVGEKAMVMLVTFSGHTPFVLPEHLRKIHFDGNYTDAINNYMTTANYTDAAIETMIEYLKTRSDWEDTMVVITGDHEGLAAVRQIALKNPDARKFVDPGLHTPFIVLNSPRPGRYDDELGQVDLYSTILDLMGLDDYIWKGMGFSIFNLNNNTNNNTNNNPLPLHIQQARDISDKIIKFDLLKNYPNSILKDDK